MNKSIRPWLVMIGAFIMLFTSIGLGSSGLTMFYEPVTAELGFSQAGFSLYYSIATLVGMFFMPLIGGYLTKHMNHVRPIMLICGVGMLISFIGYSRCQTLWQFYLFSGLRGIITCGISAVPATMLINNWFEERRAFVTSIAFMGSSFGGVVFTQFSRIFIERAGWRVSYVATGILALVTVVIAVLLVSPDPASAGTQAFGHKDSADGGTSSHTEGMSYKDALRSKMFWIFIAATFIGSLVIMGVQQRMVSSLVIDYGFTNEKAAAIYSLCMVILCGGKLLYGWISDRFRQTVATIYIGILNVLAMFFFLQVGRSSNMAYMMAFLFGLGNMTATVLMADLTSHLFGLKDYGRIYGLLQMTATCAMSIGPLITARIFDTTGSYRGAWVFYMIISAVAMALFLVSLRMKNRNKSE